MGFNTLLSIFEEKAGEVLMKKSEIDL